MNIVTEKNASIIIEKCKKRGVELELSHNHDPIDFISITNSKDDMVSVAEDSLVYEPAMYAAPWSDYILNWAKAEGFSEEVIESQSLIRSVSLDEAIDYLCR